MSGIRFLLIHSEQDDNSSGYIIIQESSLNMCVPVAPNTQNITVEGVIFQGHVIGTFNSVEEAINEADGLQSEQSV